MFIPYSELLKKYDLKVYGILHIGAHNCEENEQYKNGGCSNVIWIEANTELCKKNKHLNVLNYLVTDKDDEEVQFKITNNGQSSSIYDFGTHKKLFPGINFIKEELKKTATVKKIYCENNISPSYANFLNIDIQGAELLALKGMGELLDNFDYLYLEVNDDYVYKNCCLVSEIDEYVSRYNFKRVETKWHLNQKWGDAFYIKSN